MTIRLPHAAGAALLAIALSAAAMAPGRAKAGPLDCDGLNLGGAGGVLISPYLGRIGCIVAAGASLALNGTASPAADVPPSSVQTFTYDMRGAVENSVDSAGTSTGYLYDDRNRLSEVQEDGAAEPRLRFTYDVTENVLQQVDGPGRTTTYTYDSLNRTVRVDDTDTGAGTTTRFDYDYTPSGKLEQVTDPDAGGGLIMRYEYDGVMLKSAVDAAGRLTTFLYDSNDRLTETVETPPDPAEPAIRTRYEYDGLNRIFRGTYDADGASPIITEYQYDPLSGLLSQVDNGVVSPLYLTTSLVAEPGTLALMGVALLALAGLSRGRRAWRFRPARSGMLTLSSR